MASVPTTFTNGTVADADEVNGNFTALIAEFDTSTGHDHDGSDSKKVDMSTPVITSQAQGDVLYASSATAWARLGKGTNGHFLQQGATIPSWVAVTGLRVATKVVAASDSIDTDSVDYACDGTADEVQIQEAIDALDAAGTQGGRVILLEGTYVIAASITMAAGDEGLILQGQGWHTILKAVENLNDEIINITADRVTIRDLKLDTSANGQSAAEATLLLNGADDCLIENVHIAGTIAPSANPQKSQLSLIDCDRTRILNSLIRPIAQVDGYLVTFSGGSQFIRFQGNTVDARLGGELIMSGNLNSGFSNCIIANNTFLGDGVDAVQAIILLNDASYSYNMIVNNQSYNFVTRFLNIDGANVSKTLVDGNVMATGGVDDTGTDSVIGDNVTI